MPLLGKTLRCNDFQYLIERVSQNPLGVDMATTLFNSSNHSCKIHHPILANLSYDDDYDPKDYVKSKEIYVLKKNKDS